MIYIPVKIKEYIKDKDDNKFIICDAIVNTRALTEFRNIKKVKLDLLKTPRSSFKNKMVKKGQIYVLIFKNGEYKTCIENEINEWGDYIFEKYEKYINDDYNKKLKTKPKRKKRKEYNNNNNWGNWNFFNFGLGDINFN